MNLFCFFSVQYLLDFAPFLPKDSNGAYVERDSFDVKKAAKSFKYYVRENENLLTANLVTVFYSCFMFYFF